MELQEDDVLALDHAVDRLLELGINEKQFAGRIVPTGHKGGFQIEEVIKC